QAEIKIMVADRKGVITHQVHSGDVRLAAENRGEGGTYEKIPAVHHQDMICLFSDCGEQGGATRHSSQSRIVSVLERLARPMVLAGVQNRKGCLRDSESRRNQS